MADDDAACVADVTFVYLVVVVIVVIVVIVVVEELMGVVQRD